jgi:hypothetical protein
MERFIGFLLQEGFQKEIAQDGIIFDDENAFAASMLTTCLLALAHRCCSSRLLEASAREVARGTQRERLILFPSRFRPESFLHDA